LLDGEQTFVVTHPFHPLKGREFALVTYRHNWGEDRVYFHDDLEKLSALPASWTSLAPKDPFREVAAERCLLRFVDLVELLALARQIAERGDATNWSAGGSCPRDYAAAVHKIVPETEFGSDTPACETAAVTAKYN
jgi:hypothetical protein